MDLHIKRKHAEIDPDEIFLDSENLPDFDTHQLEGTIERPIPKRAVLAVAGVFLSAFLLLGWKVSALQVLNGRDFKNQSENNSLKHIAYFAERGIIYDRNQVELAWNDPDRVYIKDGGYAHLLGHLGHPEEEEIAKTNIHPEELIGRIGVERVFESQLHGTNGLKIVETDVKGQVRSENIFTPSLPGEEVHLSIDSRIQTEMYTVIKDLAEDRGFESGAGVMMDIHTGELLAITSYPEYDPANPAPSLNDPRKPFLPRALGGVYTPGSIIKPFVALGALEQKITTPERIIVSTGSISIQNPYDPEKKTVFKDWKAHGPVNLRRAIAVSSDVYFYVVGGGFEGKPGLGIREIERYARMFGFGQATGIELEGEAEGVIPSPEWKAANFDGEEWFLGNTYHTSIGQYGFGVTPIQVVRAVAAIANKGTLIIPSIEKRDTPRAFSKIPIPENYFKIVQEGMRMGVNEGGTAAGLDIPAVKIAAKTGTAEIGVTKARVNSWVTGFFPYENPRYAFAMVLERGPRDNTIGAVFAGRKLFEWMAKETPEYLSLSATSTLKNKAE